MGIKETRALMAKYSGLPPDVPRVILATGRFLGEGFDDERLDTLFLAFPVSWRGTIAQYAGRLHRLCEGKEKVVIYDYADTGDPVLSAMFRRRCVGYRAIGYDIMDEADDAAPSVPASTASPFQCDARPAGSDKEGDLFGTHGVGDGS